MTSDTPTSPAFFRRMHTQFNRIFEWTFARRIRHVRLSQNEKEGVAKQAKDSKIIYVLKQASVLEFNFFNALFTREGVPLAGFAPQIRAWILFWLPWRTALVGLSHWIRDSMRSRSRLWRHYLAEDLERFLDTDEPLLLCLTPEYRPHLWGQDKSSVAYLDVLLDVARRKHRDLAFVPLHYIYDYRAEKSPSKWISFLTDYRFQQGLLPRLWYFLWGSRRMGKLELGAPIPLETTNPYLLEETLSNAFKQERLRLAGPHLATPREIYRELLLDPAFRAGLRHFSGQGEASEAFLREVERHFFEIAADMHPSYIDFYDLILRRVFKHLYKGLSIDEEGLEKLKALSGKASIVFVPNHRSHADYLLLSYILYEHHMTPPHVCAGINLKFWPMSYFFRRGGSFFIHRNIDESSLYAFVLKSYLWAIAKRGYSLEFFIEGTRSRTGKLLQPKLGFLKFTVEAFLRGMRKDLCFVPVSITYDKVLEDKSYAEEKAGKNKKQESLLDLVRLKQFVRGNYGRVHIRFSPPLSLSEFLGEIKEGERTPQLAATGRERGRLRPNSLRPEGATLAPKKEPERATLTALAARIAHGINQNLVTTASSLVATAFLQSTKPCLSGEEVFAAVEPYLDYLSYRRRPLTPLLETRPAQAIKEALELFVRSRLLRGVVDHPHFFYTLDADKRPALDYYKNNAVHFFVSLACVARLLLQTTLREPLTLAMLTREFDRLKALLHLEFTFSLRLPTARHAEEILGYCRDKGWVDPQSDRIAVTALEGSTALAGFSKLLDPFLEAYWLTATAIETLSFHHMQRKLLVKKIIDMGKTKLLRGHVRLPESLNPWTLGTALDYFRGRGIVVSHEADEGKKGRDFYSKTGTPRPSPLSLQEERSWLESLLVG